MNWQDVHMNILFCFQLDGNNNGEATQAESMMLDG